MYKKFITSVLACVMAISYITIPVSATGVTGPLDEVTKQAYYQEYIKVAAEVSKETELDISVVPMNEFQEEDWRTPEQFRDFITEVASWHLVCTNQYDGPQVQSTATATKTAKVTADGYTYALDITGSFRTDLNTSTGRQHFSGINSITSKLSGHTGTWTQTGYEAEGADAARTYVVTVSGKLTIAGAVFNNKLAKVEFYCSATGVVS